MSKDFQPCRYAQVVSERITRASCKLCQHAQRDEFEQGLVDGVVVPKVLDRDMGWREGTTDRHFRNHMGEYHMGSNSDCMFCTHHLRAELEHAYFTGSMPTEEMAKELGCAESSVYHHLKHHLKPLVQKSAAPVIAIQVGKEMGALHSNMERLNGELNLMLDDADRNEPNYIRNLTMLHKEVRETLTTMMKLQDRAMGETEQNIQAETVNILKIELAKESPEIWARIRNKLMNEVEDV